MSSVSVEARILSALVNGTDICTICQAAITDVPDTTDPLHPVVACTLRRSWTCGCMFHSGCTSPLWPSGFRALTYWEEDVVEETWAVCCPNCRALTVQFVSADTSLDHPYRMRPDYAAMASIVPDPEPFPDIPHVDQNGIPPDDNMYQPDDADMADANAEDWNPQHAEADEIPLPFFCDACGIGFQTLLDFQLHVQQAHPNTFQCDLCGAQANDRDLVINHVSYFHHVLYTPSNYVFP